MKKNKIASIYTLLATCTVLIGFILLGSNWKEFMNNIQINNNQNFETNDKIDNSQSDNKKENIDKESNDNTSYGDIDEDGKITSADAVLLKKYLENKENLTEQAKKNADINGDNKVNELDSVLLSGILVEIYEHDITKPLTNYVIYGDIDEDGKITSADAVLLKKYLENKEKLTEQAKKNADINDDGTINNTDSTLLGEFLVDMHKDTLPYKPIK